jgi:hypothetical protein
MLVKLYFSILRSGSSVLILRVYSTLFGRMFSTAFPNQYKRLFTVRLAPVLYGREFRLDRGLL